jgi:hypothetical protein
MSNLSPELLKEIEKLVKRANHGDQNAMAMIEQVRKNAQGGVALAQQSHAAIMQCVMGADPAAPTIAPDAKQALAAMKNPAITPDRLLQILCFMPHVADGALLHVACIVLSKLPEPKVAVAQTMVPPATVQASAEFGYARHALDHARRIQAVRNAGLPPSQINADMGWELDC